MLILSFSDVEKALPVKDCISAVHEAFEKFASRRAAIAPTRIWHQFSADSAYIYAISAAIPEEDILVLKTLSVNWENTKKRRIPHQYGIIYLCENTTGVPVCIMDGVYITNIRTGAVGGLAARYLARKDSRNVAVLGSRELARYTLLALKEEVPSVGNVRVFSPTKKNRENFAEEMKDKVDANISAVESVDQAVQGADIIITATAAHEPILFKRHVNEGTLVISIGSDFEVEANVLGMSKVVAECEECKTFGKFGLALREGIMREHDLYAWLTDLVSGRKPGRVSSIDVMFFDSIGIAIEDSTPAWIAYENSKKMGIGTELDMYRGRRLWD